MKYLRTVVAVLFLTAFPATWIADSLASDRSGSSTNDSRLIGGVLLMLEDTTRPACSTSLQGFVYNSEAETTICLDGQWKVAAIDSDGDGHTEGTDEDDTDPSDNGDSQLLAENIKEGVDIFDVIGTLSASGAVDNDGDGHTVDVDDNDNDPSDNGDPQLLAENIKSGVDIFNIVGTYPVRQWNAFARANDLRLTLANVSTYPKSSPCMLASICGARATNYVVSYSTSATSVNWQFMHCENSDPNANGGVVRTQESADALSSVSCASVTF